MKKIKRFLAIFLSAILSIAFCCSCQAEKNSDTANAQSNQKNDFSIIMEIGNPTMLVNGEEQSIDGTGTAPLIFNGRTLVPIRSIIETMGGKVDWDQSTLTSTLTYNNDKINLVINSDTAYLNDKESTLDTVPIIVDGRTMLPIRFIAESFNFDVDWNQAKQTITIKKAATNSNAAVSENSEPTADSKILVVYYSATGSTENVAKYIADETNADIFEIKPVKPYTSDDLNWSDDNSRVSIEHNNESERVVELETTTVPNWAEYDTVFIGYPIWWGIAAWPVNGFVEANDFSGKTVIPFCTSVSSGLGNSGKNLEKLANTGDWLEGQRFSSGANENDVKDWAKSVVNK